MNDYKQEIINVIVEGTAVTIGIIIVFAIIILVMKLVFEKKIISSLARKLLYILMTVIFIVVLLFSVSETIEDVSYYKNLKEKIGTVERIQYFGEYGRDSEHKASVVELKDKQGEKDRYILNGKNIPYVTKGTKMKVIYDDRKYDTKTSNNITGYIKTYVTY